MTRLLPVVLALSFGAGAQPDPEAAMDRVMADSSLSHPDRAQSVWNVWGHPPCATMCAGVDPALPPPSPPETPYDPYRDVGDADADGILDVAVIAVRGDEVWLVACFSASMPPSCAWSELRAHTTQTSRVLLRGSEWHRDKEEDLPEVMVWVDQAGQGTGYAVWEDRLFVWAEWII